MRVGPNPSPQTLNPDPLYPCNLAENFRAKNSPYKIDSNYISQIPFNFYAEAAEIILAISRLSADPDRNRSGFTQSTPKSW
jgi:hypothetical protein